MRKENDQGTREALIASAKKEFLEKGYNKASLRSICSDAGLTTGALYFLFENKADLYSAIVDPPLNGLKQILGRHFEEDRKEAAMISSLDEMDLDHSWISDMIVSYIYENYDSFMLLLTASENTKYENVVDEFVELVDNSVVMMMQNIKGYTYDKYMSHWMSHISIDAFIHEIKHEKDVNTAKKRLSSILNYLVMGWLNLALVKK
ncbi:MAG: TetR/AcrR family transcriptional regulator [Lachnospiraceae bacterium]|nr:TetR/AcrR family transcriptional regulator [Lachnospiraceae bacterium]